MSETITTLDILNRLERKVQIIKDAIKNKDVDRLKDVCACSLICGDETILTEVPVLDDTLCFNYKGFDCELSSCNNIIEPNQILGLNDKTDIRKRFPHCIFTDRYVCWLSGHKDDDGKTLDEYLEGDPNETEDDNCWAPRLYLVPDAWTYGASFDLKPGSAVDKLILKKIDKFLKQNPDL